MSKLILNSECKLYARDGQVLYSSRQVADEFSKRHSNVLRDIDVLISLAQSLSRLSENAELYFVRSDNGTELKSELSETFIKENFFEHEYKDISGKWSREVLMTRNGSSVLVMGFTGRRAFHFKILLMERFDQMESFIISLNAARLEHPAFTEAIFNAYVEPKHYHFSNESDMINRIALGKSAKQFRLDNGIAKGKSIRPYLNTEQIQAIEMLQRVDIGLLLAIPDYDQRKQILAGYHKRLKLKRIAS